MSKWKQLYWARTCFELIMGASIALLLYLAIMNLVVSKSLLFSLDARRIIEVYKFCSSLGTGSHKNSNFIIGSSITVEGIDADILDQALNNGTSTYNLGVVGMTSVEALMLEPAFKAAKPQVMVIGIDAMSVGIDKAKSHDKEGIEFEKLQAYRATNSIANMDSPVKKELLENILLPKEKAIIESDYLTYLMGCRSLPIFFIESKFRGLMRKGLRTEEAIINFKSPWMLKSNLTGEAKERIISSTMELALRLSFDEESRNIKALRALIRILRTENIDSVLVIWPVHPRVYRSLSADLLDRTDATLKSLAQEGDGIYQNYSTLLSDSDFADALHPNSEGRAKLSANLAIDLKSFYTHLNTP